jgi:hypothetical protein
MCALGSEAHFDLGQNVCDATLNMQRTLSQSSSFGSSVEGLLVTSSDSPVGIDVLLVTLRMARRALVSSQLTTCNTTCQWVTLFG